MYKNDWKRKEDYHFWKFSGKKSRKIKGRRFHLLPRAPETHGTPLGPWQEYILALSSLFTLTAGKPSTLQSKSEKQLPVVVSLLKKKLFGNPAFLDFLVKHKWMFFCKYTVHFVFTWGTIHSQIYSGNKIYGIKLGYSPEKVVQVCPAVKTPFSRLSRLN